MYKYFAILILFYSNSVNAQVNFDSLVNQYVLFYKNIAIEEMQRSHIPASITLAQGILESDAGRSPLATEAKNHFGIKCHDVWTGETYIQDDDEKDECFRKYADSQDSYKDHSDFLTSRPRYASLFSYPITDYKSWAHGLKKCGYATNPQYATLLIKNIEKFDLYQYDYPANYYATKKDSMHKTISQQKPLSQFQNNIDPNDISSRVLYVNNVRCVRILQGETIEDIGKRFDIGTKRVLKYNDLLTSRKFIPGSIIYVQPKKRLGDSIFHYVKNNETMYDISQIHGVQLLYLYQRNNIKSGDEPANGELIYLQGTRNSQLILRNNIPIDSTGITTPEEYIYHTVKVGDTLYSVSKAYNISIEKIKMLNKLYSDTISTGMRLKIKE
jgi:LysM repeat protein